MSAPEPLRICFVCSGNICRSPMAEVVLRDLAEERGLADSVVVDSGGFESYHVGEGADRRAVRELEHRGHDGSLHRARHIEAEWLADHDLLVAMDRGHEAALHRLARRAGSDADIRLMSTFVAEGAPGHLRGLDVDDPWYGDDEGFVTTYDHVRAGCEGILDWVESELADR